MWIQRLKYAATCGLNCHDTFCFMTTCFNPSYFFHQFPLFGPCCWSQFWNESFLTIFLSFLCLDPCLTLLAFFQTSVGPCFYVLLKQFFINLYFWPLIPPPALIHNSLSVKIIHELTLFPLLFSSSLLLLLLLPSIEARLWGCCWPSFPLFCNSSGCGTRLLARNHPVW